MSQNNQARLSDPYTEYWASFKLHLWKKHTTGYDIGIEAAIEAECGKIE
uniref:Uncharacterized protein n=1 Tax=Lepeophtheirus salmonis TaxID=72036 RepID=A0A0K2TCN4_LEPSM